MAFPIDHVYLNGNVLVGAVRRYEAKASIVESDNGLITVTPKWPRRRRAWTLSYALEDTDEVENLFDVNGTEAGFLYIAADPDGDTTKSDYIAEDQLIGVGDGSTTQFQLSVTAATYNTSNSPPTVARSVTRDHKYPISGTVVVYLNDTPSVAFTVSTSTGIVTMTSAPANGVDVTADFHFAYPVRFVSETFDVTLGANHKEIRSVAIEEVFEA
jgi:uncharacterized protein (TIGR02217 family)